MSDVKERRPEWLWRGRFPLAAFSMIVGDPEQGKSLLTKRIAAHVTTGANWPDGSPCPKGSVIIITSEETSDVELAPRLRVAGADLTKVMRLRGFEPVQGGDVNPIDMTRACLEMVEEAVRGMGDVKLVIVDPISAFMGPDTNCNTNEQVRIVLGAVSTLAETYGVAIIGINHLSKNADRAALARSLGSTGFVAHARAVWFVGRDPRAPAEGDDGGRKCLVRGKNNWAKYVDALAFTIMSAPAPDGEIPVIAWGEVFKTTDNAVLGTSLVGMGSRGRPPAKRQNAEAWLAETLKEGSALALVVEEAAEEAGISIRTLARAKKDLGVASVKGVDGWRWEMPKEGARAPE